MSFRRGSVSLDEAVDGKPYLVIALARPTDMRETVWRRTLLRLEELGLFPGVIMHRAAPGFPGAVILRVGGGCVAVSREVAMSVLLRPV